MKNSLNYTKFFKEAPYTLKNIISRITIAFFQVTLAHEVAMRATNNETSKLNMNYIEFS